VPGISLVNAVTGMAVFTDEPIASAPEGESESEGIYELAG
jgi:hypothetical protein